MLQKLECYGIRGIVNGWISRYLSNRQQFVQIDDCSSDLPSIKYGVPQGAILGLKQFILYINDILHINDICNVPDVVKFIIFVDDDCDLNWKEQMKRVNSNVTTSLAIMYNLGELLTTSSIKILYNCSVFTYINYCLEMWGNT